VSRTANEKRPEELCSAIVRYLIRHGLADLSLRPLAKAVGSSPRVLLYYFGSKEKMVIKVLSDIRRKQRVTYARVKGTSFADEYQAVWRHMSAASSEPHFRLYFEAYGMALRRPRLYKVFLHDTIEDWLRMIADELRREGYKRAEARAFATVVVAGLRGFMLDFCATGDRKRVDRAVALWLHTLDSLLPLRHGSLATKLTKNEVH
jgi:AcrR family transcriptional regulator